MSEVWRGSTSVEMWAEIAALRGRLDAVLALHRPYDDEMACRACTQSIPVPWPCPTVRAIEGTEDA